MTVEANTVSYSYTGDGASTAFPFPSKFLVNTDLKVSLNGSLQVSGYSVSGAGNDNGGNVTFTIAPPNGVRVTLVRDPPISQLTEFEDAAATLGNTVENVADRQAMVSQVLRYRSERALRLDDADTPATLTPLPSRALRAKKLLAFDDNGDPYVTLPAEFDGGIAPPTTNHFFLLETYGGGPAKTPAENNAAFQAAIDAIVLAGGGELRLPAGQIRLAATPQIVIPKIYDIAIRIRGVGHATRLTLDAPMSTAPIYVGSAVAAGGIDLEFSDLMFRGQSPTTGRAIRAVNANGVKFIRCGFQDLQFGVDATESYFVQMLDCFSLNVGLYLFYSSTKAHGFRLIGGAHYNGGVASTGALLYFAGQSTDNVIIRDADLEYCRQVANFMAGCTNLVVEGNYIEYCLVSAFGFGAASYAITIEQNWLALAQGGASILLDGTNWQNGSFSRNHCYGTADFLSQIINISPHIDYFSNYFTGTAVNYSLTLQQATLLNNFTAGDRLTGFRKQGSVLHVRGHVIMGTGSNGNVVFNIPAGVRPKISHKVPLVGGAAADFGYAFIDSVNGNVVVNMATGTPGLGVNLDNINILLS